MKKHVILLIAAVTASLFMAGCGGSPKLSSAEKALFETAAPEVKQMFETALTADKANNYVSATTNYQALLHQKLTPEQVMAMQTAFKSLTERVYAASAKGDAGAKTALELLKGNHPR